jgi:hypothetical protein
MKGAERDSVVHETISFAIERGSSRAGSVDEEGRGTDTGYDQGTRVIVFSVVLCAVCWAALGYFLLT